jgi:phage gpG-like protein
MSIESILAELDAEIKRLQEVRKLLAGTGTHSSATKPVAKKRRRKMSAAARKRIADAQRARWAKRKAAK